MYTERDSKISISTEPKPRGSKIANGFILFNIDPFAIFEPRELSLRSKCQFLNPVRYRFKSLKKPLLFFLFLGFLSTACHRDKKNEKKIIPRQSFG